MSLALSVLFFALAIGIWLVQRGSVDIAADIVPPVGGQSISLISTYSSEQQACVRSVVGAARYDALLIPGATALTQAERDGMSSCLDHYPVEAAE